MTIHRNFILTLNSRRIMCAVMSRREAAYPSAGMAGPMDPETRRDGGFSHRRTEPCVT
jgi:hypothetical protein